MSGDRWSRLEALFHAALPLDPAAREAFLGRERLDPELRAELDRLLMAHRADPGFIDVPAVRVSGVLESDDERGLEGRRVGAYRILREIARGGMGAVYLAERADGQYEGRVAIKVIKRGMDTDQVLARFRAERQILASLEHPNIARLVDGGTTDDGRPYFAMEYIEGERIDGWCAAHGLDVDARLALFLRVCDAVAYAHRHQVVHRDIKPLNILVAGDGTPKLLDFGIAKVLQEAPDETTATATGLRLLTPEYASPEQVDGRAATTLSDVYSLGVLLYELLTGRSPYRLASHAPRDVIAAVCTTDPERPSTAVTRAPDPSGRSRPMVPVAPGAPPDAQRLRRRLRGDLDAIILTALRKEPARRYASVTDFADDVRRHLERRPVRARPVGAAYRAATFVRRHRTPITAAAAAATVVALAATAALWLTRTDDPAPALAARDRVVVADFTDLAGDPTLTAAVAEAVRIDLGQSERVRILTPRQVRNALQVMEQPVDIALDDSLARELAVREGVAAIVTGSLARISGAYAVTLELVGAREGETLATVRETAADSSRLLQAVDRASSALRRRIGESARTLRSEPPLDRATTASVPALRHYMEGRRLVRTGERTDALRELEAAVAIDPAFASAHLVLGMMYGAMNDMGRSFAAMEHAFSHRDRLTFVERSFIEGALSYAREDYGATIGVYERLLARYPDNVPAVNNLALAYRDSRDYRRAAALFRRAIDLDSTIANLYFGLHSTQVMAGDFVGSRITLDTIFRRFPENPLRFTEAMQDAAARQAWREVERHAHAQIASAGADSLQLLDPYEVLAGVAMTEGRLQDAERYWAAQQRLAEATGSHTRRLFGVIQLANLRLRHRHDAAAAVRLLDSALAAHPLDSMLPGDRRYDEVARFQATVNRVPEARRLLTAADANDSLLRRDLRAERGWTRGVIALGEGRRAAAVEELRAAAAMHVCAICVLPDLGRAEEAAADTAAAIATYERYTVGPWIWRYEPDAVELAWVLARLADLHAARGAQAAASRNRERLHALWAAADPELLATVAGAPGD